MPQTLFVDTNIFLSLYAFSDDDLRQIRELFVLSQEGEINFILTDQVVNEFWRNRESKLKEALNKIAPVGQISIPAPVRELEEAHEVTFAKKKLDEALKELRIQLVEKARSTSFEADKLIQEIFEKSKVVETTEEVLRKAEIRVSIGNPPGKHGSLGDAINWECVLSEVEFLDSLSFVSRDKDYESKLHPGSFNEFLTKELMGEAVATVQFYPSLRSFLKDKFPDVKIEGFSKAGAAVEALETSGSFASTHLAIASLSEIEKFSVNQVKRLIVAAEENSQVEWILGDDDVSKFYQRLEGEFSRGLERNWRERLEKIVRSEQNEETESWDEIPF